MKEEHPIVCSVFQSSGTKYKTAMTYIIFFITGCSVYSQFYHNQIHTPSLASLYIQPGTHGFALDDVDKSHQHTKDHIL